MSMQPLRPALTGLLLTLLSLPLQASPSFDELKSAALRHHPDTMVSDIAQQPGDSAGEQYRLRLRDARGNQRELVLDASGKLLKDNERKLQSGATLPMGWVPGEQQPSFDRLNRIALERYPGGEVSRASLRQISGGRTLYDLQMTDALGLLRQLVIDAHSSEVLTDRRM